MTPRPSRLLANVRQGRPVVILKLNLSDPRVVEIAGLSGADAVWLCNEHVPNDWIALENQIRAARLHNMDTIVRVSRGSYSDYIRPFEADATGILVPHVASAADAQQIVEWVRFHPLGKRPIDGGNADGQFCLVSTADYIRHANSERFLILQIESPAALARLDEIAAVPGFDGFCFGPGDFAHLLGRPGQIRDPEVVAARQRVAATARRHGKFAMAAGLVAPFEELLAEGHQVFSAGADVVGLAGYFKQRVELLCEPPVLPPAAGATPKPAAQSPYAV
jgi:4-hydroxy-2-oxoheptanedioate aldolase